MLRRRKTGQSTAEYAIVIGLVIAAVLAMQVYVKRGIQAKFKDASDANITAINATVFYGVNDVNQYEPQYATSTDMVSTRNATETTTVSTGGEVTRAINGTETSTRTGMQEILSP